MQPGTEVEYVNGKDEPDVPPDNGDRGKLVRRIGKFIVVDWDLWGERPVHAKHVREVK